MTYRLVVWLEAGNWSGVGFQPQKDLGTHNFGELPVEGNIVEIRGEEYRVTSVSSGFMHVRPNKLKAR